MAKNKTIIEVHKNPNENSNSLVRRFSRKMQESGVIPKVKSIRYNERDISKLKVKRGKLKKLAKRAQYEKLRKLGKVR